MIRNTLALAVLSLVVACKGCEGGSSGGEAGTDTDPSSGSETAETEGTGTDTDGPVPGDCIAADEAPPDETLQWKRGAALVEDLKGALELDLPCTEFGVADCAAVHLVPLGGKDPFGAAMYRAVAEPMATTAMALDRMVLSACTNRVDLDAAGDPVVFTHFDLAGAAPGLDPARALAAELYQRLLGRDATPAELDEVATVASEGTARDYAVLACYAIGTTTEFLFF